MNNCDNEKELKELLVAKEKENEKLKKKISNRDETIRNQQGHIEQLLEVERSYERVINSKGWKIVSAPGKIFEKSFPVGTSRRKVIASVRRYVSALNLNNIKFVLSAMKKGGLEQVKAELAAFNERADKFAMAVEKPALLKTKDIKSLQDCEKLVFPRNDKPLVSIIIPVYNQFQYTYYCLKSILKNSYDVSYEIIIADDVSDDLTVNIYEVAENITVVRNEENLRFLKNCNNAAKKAKGKYILFLNNDTQVMDDWLQPLIDLIESSDDIGMVGSKLIYPDGKLQEAGGIVWGDGHAWNYGHDQNPQMPEFNYVKEVDYISGAALMIRADLWNEIGGFDEYFAPAYCEDSDLAFEVRKHGYKLMYQPLSVVVHFEGKSNGTDTTTGLKAYQVENSKKLAEKWADEFKNQSQEESDLFHARERSQGKKCILVIDHYVPEYDKDAGSKTTWQYLNVFVSKGYNVKFLPDNFSKTEPYTDMLEQIGIEVLYGAYYQQNWKEWIVANKNNIDFVYFNRPHITVKYIDFIKAQTDAKCIYYGHDLHFLRIKREYELNGDQKLLTESENWKKQELSIMRKADISYYPSSIEADEIHNIDEEIPVKAITAYVFEKFRDDLNLDYANREDIMFVGGFGHPPNEDAVNWFLEEVFPKIREKLDIKFHIVGSKTPDRIQKLNGKNGIIVEGRVSEERLQSLYDNCRMVVVPLRYGAGVKGKVVEAIYYGIPTVTTTVGIEGITGAENFMAVADDAEGFANKVIGLYQDINKLKSTTEEYQKYVKENYSIEAVWNVIKEDFE